MRRDRKKTLVNKYIVDLNIERLFNTVHLISPQLKSEANVLLLVMVRVRTFVGVGIHAHTVARESICSKIYGS